MAKEMEAAASALGMDISYPVATPSISDSIEVHRRPKHFGRLNVIFWKSLAKGVLSYGAVSRILRAHSYTLAPLIH